MGLSIGSVHKFVACAAAFLTLSALQLTTSIPPKPALRVLIVEDSDEDAELLLRELRRAYEVTHVRVTDSAGLRAALGAGAWDLVAADYMLPQFDGFAALAVVQELGLDIPFLMVSGKMGEEAAVAAMKAGAHDYLVKDNLTRLLPAVARERREAEERRERRRAETSLARTEDMLTLAADAAGLGSWELNVSTGEVIVSAHCRTLFGWPPDSAVTYQDFLERVHPADRPIVGPANLLGPGECNDFDFEYRIIRPDGAVRWIADRGRALLRSPNHSGPRMNGVVMDVTERKEVQESLRRARDELEARVAERTAELALANERLRGEIREREQAEASLRTSEQRLRHFVESNIIGMVIFDRSGRIREANDAFLILLGYTREDLAAGRIDWHALTPPEYCDRDQRAACALADSGAFPPYEKECFHANGSRVPVLIGGSVFDRNDAMGLGVGFVLDLTERKGLERELLRVSEREQQRIGQDLHDGLCQHLTGVRYRSAILQKQLDAISPSHARDAGLIGDLLNQGIEQARNLAHGLHPVKLEDNGLMSALQELADHVESVFGCTCECHISQAALLDDYPAATHLYRIAQEAITNAIKHGKAGRIVVSLLEERDSLVLRVDDDGVGFVFPLESRSSGMGLRFMNYRASALGASLTISPRSPRGTRVECRLCCTCPVPA
jgi:PAS domain S-box-containing protein